MSRLSKIRRHAPLALLLFLLMTGAHLANAQDPTPAPEATPVPGCAECHINHVLDWQQSTHAQAYSDPVFQAAWAEKGRDTTCLACHTTGYVAQTGAFSQATVGCEACHGQTPTNHPPEPVGVNLSVSVCADCHATTFSEWQKSAHGTQNIACTTCHTPHTQQLRFASPSDLCTDCHTEPREEYVHVAHPEQTCADCHWYKAISPEQHVLTGNLLPTGHDNHIETRTCTDCHGELAKNLNIAEPGMPDDLLAARIRAEELRAEIATIEAQGENLGAVRIIEGLLIGALIGGVLMGLVLSLRRVGR